MDPLKAWNVARKSYSDSDDYSVYYTNAQRRRINSLRHIYDLLSCMADYGLIFDGGDDGYIQDVVYWLYHISALIDSILEDNNLPKNGTGAVE